MQFTGRFVGKYFLTGEQTSAVATQLVDWKTMRFISYGQTVKVGSVPNDSTIIKGFKDGEIFATKWVLEETFTLTPEIVTELIKSGCEQVHVFLFTEDLIREMQKEPELFNQIITHYVKNMRWFAISGDKMKLVALARAGVYVPDDEMKREIMTVIVTDNTYITSDITLDVCIALGWDPLFDDSILFTYAVMLCSNKDVLTLESIGANVHNRDDAAWKHYSSTNLKNSTRDKELKDMFARHGLVLPPPPAQPSVAAPHQAPQQVIHQAMSTTWVPADYPLQYPPPVQYPPVQYYYAGTGFY